MLPLQGDYEAVKKFDLEVVNQLADYFNFDFPARDPHTACLWLDNLYLLARQNLGLAHCMLHNQTARNYTSLAHNLTGSQDFDLPFHTRIGAFSFSKVLSKNMPDTMFFHGPRLTGVKRWISQLDVADHVVMKIPKCPGVILTVFVDLTKIAHEVRPSESQPIGMNIANPYDLYIDAEIPQEWILDSWEYYAISNNLHFYGMVGNHIACANHLLAQASEFGFAVDYQLKKLQLDLEIANMLRQNTASGVFDPDLKKSFQTVNTQYQFARKCLVNTVSFFLEIMSTGICDSTSQRSQVFRDSLNMATHQINLYKHINGHLTGYV